jgi:predicted TIM-barrel fold metal-dependent hydrolase
LARVALDQWATTPRTELYLPLERPLDLTVPDSFNMRAADVARMRRERVFLGFTRRGARATHTAANLLRDMEHLGVRGAVVSAPEAPWSDYPTRACLQTARRDARLHPFAEVAPGAADPLALSRAGAQGLVAWSSARADPRAIDALCRGCAELGLPVLYHLDPRSPGEGWHRPLVEHPGCTFILAHAGAPCVERARRWARELSNVYLEISSLPVADVRGLVSALPHERLLFGSSWPYSSPALALAKVLIATDDAPDARGALLWRNARRLLGSTHNGCLPMVD